MNHSKKSCPNRLSNTSKLVRVANAEISSFKSEGYEIAPPLWELCDTVWRSTLYHANGNVISVFLDYLRYEVRIWKNCRRVKVIKVNEQMRQS